MNTPSPVSQEVARLWQGFMTARLLLGTVLVILQTALYMTGTTRSQIEVAICTAYLLGTLVSKILVHPRPLGQSFNRVWGALVGVDLWVFAALQLVQGVEMNVSTINYTPLFALPLLLASVLGTLRLAFATAAGITLLMLGIAIWAFLQHAYDSTPYFVQPALSGVGFFAIAWLSNQLSTRLATEGQRARKNQMAVAIERQVNALVIESLSDGILVVDAAGQVRSANPAARELLGLTQTSIQLTFDLGSEVGWLPLYQLSQHSLQTGQAQSAPITIQHGQNGDKGKCRINANARLAATYGTGSERESLCVLFLQDERELEARIRTEKLASMGRLSTAVAHEIRNPLAAISQANALLDEDITDPHWKRLTAMVEQNVKRLDKTVNDILNVAQIQPDDAAKHLLSTLSLDEGVAHFCTEWAQQNQSMQRLVIHAKAGAECRIAFDADHLRRVLVNLLDNALRYTPNQAQTIQVLTQPKSIAVWSEAAPLDPSIERHLFEPFFSSESRSSGLGLFLCRELCERHHASIHYQRTTRTARGQAMEGNEFVISL
ncbi:MAG: hypothetical protein RIR79_491 [Pseudomonadota bacterium]|jgi:two-component system sensor histidine kinase PilS (NtrC family)